MITVYENVNDQGAKIALYHHGYLAIEPAPGHFGYQLNESDAADLIDAIKGVFPEA